MPKAKLKARTLLSCLLSFSFLTLLSSCAGYHLGRGGMDCGHQTLTLAPVCNDTHGFFTSSLLFDLKSKSDFTIASQGGELLLKVTLELPEEENIGYRYSRNDQGELTRIVVPIEARLKGKALVELIDQRECKRILGPCCVTATLDFDFQSDFSHVNEQRFALGQYEMHDLAKDEALTRLNRLLAQKVVDLLIYSW